MSAMAATVLLSACGGSDGANGINGVNGVNGTNGTNAVVTTNAAALTPEQWADAKFNASITGVTIASAPVVTFKVTDAAGNGVVGLGATSKASTATLANYPNVAFAIAKLVPGTKGSPSKWVSYNVTTIPSTSAASLPGKPTTDNTGTLVDNGDGTYKYTFWRDITKMKDTVAGMATAAKTANANNDVADLGDLTYDASLTHRVVLQLSGNARGTGTNTANAVQVTAGVPMKNPVNAVYDFIPATGKPTAATDTGRDIAKVSACFECHGKFTFHGGARQDTRFCVVCHTDQRKYGNAEASATATGYSGTTYKINGRAVGDLPAFIHRLHMGEALTKTGYNYANIEFNEIHYPQDQRNCVKCHDGSANAANKTAQGDNWKTVPSRLACGACHDGIDWTTGKGTALGDNGKAVGGHVGGAQSSDANCALCHDSAAIVTYHMPINAPDPNNIYLVPTGGNNNTNASYVAAYTNNLPPGASIVTWDLNSVTLNASSQPVFKFKFVKDGVGVTFNTYSATGKTELMDNFVGGPSVYLAFAMPQDGIAKPADWNATVSGYIKNIWNGTATGTGAGTLTGPDASGYYTLTLTGVKIPAAATMLKGGIGFTYGLTATQPLTQTNVPGYPYNTDGKKQGGVSVPAPNVTKLATVTGNTDRRQIVATAKCNNCHAALGIFIEKLFHAGQRNDANACTFCHNVNRVNSGWGVNIKDAVHALHAADKRVNKFSWEATAGDQYWTTTYPNLLNNCEACHLPDTYNFGASASAAAVPNLLWTTVATGNISSSAIVIKTGDEVIPSGTSVVSPFVTLGTNYGAGFTTNFATASTTPVVDAAATTLVNSPVASACFACHDSDTARAHMAGNGGKLYAARSTVTPAANSEQCLLCHGPGKVADAKAVHMNF